MNESEAFALLLRSIIISICV